MLASASGHFADAATVERLGSQSTCGSHATVCWCHHPRVTAGRHRQVL